ncbi:ABC transporter substrate-binding protein [Pseudomonas sp. DWP3-1-2]|uniref:ABC transporter substrate-binding protein n=1 Tax=Pseudomonas sp. DWP3-1-2 TaxID=2804645 RepID=UPI003CF51B86
MPLPRLVVLLASAGFSALTLAAGPTHYPLTVDNCGVPLTFNKAPGKAVTIGQAGTEILYSLGLADRVVGTSLWFNTVLPQFKDVNDRILRLANNEPSFESVISKRPDLVPVQFEWMVGPQGAVGTREQFSELNIPTYIMPSDCEGKDNLIGADGTRLKPFSVDSLFKTVTQLAQIFDVQDRGDELTAHLRAGLAKAQASVKAKQLTDASALFWFSSADLKVDPFVAGRKGVPGFMMDTLGLRNVVESDEEWPTVGWETIARANPTVIVIARMDRRRFPADDFQKKLDFLKTDPVTQNMDAVKHNRIVILDADAMQASVRMFDGINELADAIDRVDLSQ